MVTKIVKWGNGQGIRIPKGIMQELSLRHGEEMEIKSSDGKIIIERIFRHRSLEERAEQFGGRLGPYTEKIDWGTPEGREVW